MTVVVEHSYYREGWVNQDIRLSIEGLTNDAPRRRGTRPGSLANVWKMPVRPA